MTKPTKQIRFVVRRETPEQPFQWWPVLAKKAQLAVAYPAYTYRDLFVVFCVDAPTGITIGFGKNEADAIGAANRLIKEHTAPVLKEACRAALEKLGLGDKPKEPKARR